MCDDEVKRLKEENKNLRLEVKLLRQKIDAMARRIFGKKSEQLNSGQLEFLLDQLEGTEEPEAPKGSIIAELKTKSSRKQKVRKPRMPAHLPVVETIIEPDSVQKTPEDYRKIGQEVSDLIDYVPGRFQVLRTIRPTYVKRCDMDAAPLTAELPARLLERGILSPGLLAHIVVSKYADHLPLYRQEQIFKQRHDVKLPRQTLARGVELVADWLNPIVQVMINQQLKSGYLQIDETPVKYLSPGQGKTSQGYFWAVHVPTGDTVYHWTSGRGAEHLLRILPKDYKGVVQCDGYGVYPCVAKKIKGMELAGCWAHVRRKFYEAFEQKESLQLNGWILKQIGHLYRIEQELRESRAGPALRNAIRSSQSQLILKRLHRLFNVLYEKRGHLPQSLTGKALGYALRQWELLEVYAHDGRIEIDNNLVENAMRPTALGRKNWLFIGADEAGWRSAVIYTLIQSCKAYGVEPYGYLKDVLERLPSMTNHQIPEITPKAWAESIKPALKIAS
jgi:transposase